MERFLNIELDYHVIYLLQEMPLAGHSLDLAVSKIAFMQAASGSPQTTKGCIFGKV